MTIVPRTSLFVLILLLASITLQKLTAGSATWNSPVDGQWTDTSRWSPNTTCPNGDGQSATFANGGFLSPGTRTVTVGSNVTVGTMTFIPTVSGNSYVISGASPITLKDGADNTASIGFYQPGNTEQTISVPATLDVATVAISGRKATLSGNLSASTNHPNSLVIFNLTGNTYTDSNNRILLTGSNNFGTGEIRISGVNNSALQLSGALSGGGANTTIRLQGATGNLVNLSLSTGVNYDNDVIVDGEGGGRIFLASSSPSTYRLGSITVGAARSLFIAANFGNNALHVNANEKVNVQPGGLLLVQMNRSVATTTGDLTILVGATLGGSGTVATAPNGTSSNPLVVLSSGAVLNPGDPATANSTGVLSVGGDTYPLSKLTLKPGAKFQCELSGTIAGSNYDQVAVNGSSIFTINGAVLEPKLRYAYGPGDRVFVANVGPSATVSGTFSGLGQGAAVSLGTYGGQQATAKISYTGNAATNAISGGNDIVLYDFSGAQNWGEPNWAQPWETTLVNWLKNLQEWEVTIPNQSNSRYNTNQATLEPELRRNHRLVGGSPTAPPLWIADAALSLPADSFLWPQIWRRDRPNTPTELTKRYGVTSGEWWIPSHPTTATLLAWLASWDRSWNALNYADPVEHLTVSRRAAALGIANLIMLYENAWYYYSGESGARQPAYKWGTGTVGFSLTFSAYAHWKVKDTLPPDVANAWGEGLKWFATKIGNAPPGGPENMQLSAPVGIYYTYLGTGDSTLAALAQTHLNTILSTAYSPAGYIRDGGFPDGSYNGIALHRLAEYWSLTQSSNVLQILQAAYDLKQYLTLVEPNGSRIGPSHFNFRCADGYDTDQYAGREVQFLLNVPTAALFVKNTPHWPATVTWQQVKADIDLRTNQGSSKLSSAMRWNSGVISDWQNLLELPYVHYQQTDEAAMHTLVQNAQAPVTSQTSYTKNFNNEFFVIRRPAYAAIFYAGPATTSDNGTTNYKTMLGGAGGYFNGFGGGGLSAFWTPQSGATIIGRMNAKEAYQRQTKTIGSNTYLLPGWRDWLNNQIVGETPTQKILSSSRTGQPGRTLATDGSNLVITGTIPKTTSKQGTIISANVSYKRTYLFRNDRIDCTLELNTDVPLQMNSLYEALPVRVASDLTTVFKDAGGQVLTESGGRVLGVKTLEISRNGGVTRVVFQVPVNFTMDTVTVPSEQITRVSARSYLVELPASLQPGTNGNPAARLDYSIVPGT